MNFNKKQIAGLLGMAAIIGVPSSMLVDAQATLLRAQKTWESVISPAHVRARVEILKGQAQAKLVDAKIESQKASKNLATAEENLEKVKDLLAFQTEQYLRGEEALSDKCLTSMVANGKTLSREDLETLTAQAHARADEFEIEVEQMTDHVAELKKIADTCIQAVVDHERHFQAASRRIALIDARQAKSEIQVANTSAIQLAGMAASDLDESINLLDDKVSKAELSSAAQFKVPEVVGIFNDPRQSLRRRSKSSAESAPVLTKSVRQ